jgi:hypothetical protein
MLAAAAAIAPAARLAKDAAELSSRDSCEIHGTTRTSIFKLTQILVVWLDTDPILDQNRQDDELIGPILRKALEDDARMFEKRFVERLSGARLRDRLQRRYEQVSKLFLNARRASRQATINSRIETLNSIIQSDLAQWDLVREEEFEIVGETPAEEEVSAPRSGLTLEDLATDLDLAMEFISRDPGLSSSDKDLLLCSEVKEWATTLKGQAEKPPTFQDGVKFNLLCLTAFLQLYADEFRRQRKLSIELEKKEKQVKNRRLSPRDENKKCCVVM